RLEVGEHAAEPAATHVVLLGSLRLRLDEGLRLALGAHEQDLAAARDRLAQEVERLLEARQRLVEVDDVDAVALAEQEALHARVPAARLGSEVAAPFETAF